MIVENDLNKSDELNLMCISISIGRRGKQKTLFECIGKWCNKCVKNASKIFFTNNVCYSRYHISK